jgi:hypothetical protein
LEDRGRARWRTQLTHARHDGTDGGVRLPAGGLTFDSNKPESLHQGELRSTFFRQVVEKSATSSRSVPLPTVLDAKHLTFFLYILGV